MVLQKLLKIMMRFKYCQLSAPQKLAFVLAVFTYMTESQCSQKIFSRHAGSRMEFPSSEAQLVGRSRMECADECAKTPTCKSANFHAAQGTCEVNLKNVDDVTASLISADGWEILNLKGGSPGWLVYGASEYYYSAEGKTWPDAKAQCESMSAHLADVLNAEEHDFLSGSLDPLYTDQNYWLGGSDLAVTGEWRWLSGQAIAGFTPWAPEEPNNSGNVEHCLHRIPLLNQWNDAACNLLLHSFCKRPL